jgi:hypothetical protein
VITIAEMPEWHGRARIRCLSHWYASQRPFVDVRERRAGGDADLLAAEQLRGRACGRELTRRMGPVNRKEPSSHGIRACFGIRVTEGLSQRQPNLLRT